MSEIPKAAPTRQQFRSLDECVEMALFTSDTRGFTPQQVDIVRKILRRCGESVVDECAHAFQKGIERGITQTAEVFVDPEYYSVTKKKRTEARRRQAQKSKEDREKQQQEYLQPSTPAQIASKRARLIGMIDYHTQQAERYRKERDEFEKAPEVFYAAAMNSKTNGVV